MSASPEDAVVSSDKNLKKTATAGTLYSVGVRLYLQIFKYLPRDLRTYWEELFQSPSGKHLYSDFVYGTMDPHDFLRELATLLHTMSEDLTAAGGNGLLLWNPVCHVLLEHIAEFPLASSTTVCHFKAAIDKIRVVHMGKTLPNDFMIVILETLHGYWKDQDLNLYSNDSHPHIDCKIGAKCKFCRLMFYCVSISACKLRCKSKCTEFGWFPHVGPGLWTILKTRHDGNAAFLVRDIKTRTGDIPSLVKVFGLNH